MRVAFDVVFFVRSARTVISPAVYRLTAYPDALEPWSSRMIPYSDSNPMYTYVMHNDVIITIIIIIIYIRKYAQQQRERLVND